MLGAPAGAYRPRAQHASAPQPAPAGRGLHCYLIVVICGTQVKAGGGGVSSNASGPCKWACHMCMPFKLPTFCPAPPPACLPAGRSAPAHQTRQSWCRLCAARERQPPQRPVACCSPWAAPMVPPLGAPACAPRWAAPPPRPPNRHLHSRYSRCISVPPPQYMRPTQQAATAGLSGGRAQPTPTNM